MRIAKMVCHKIALLMTMFVLIAAASNSADNGQSPVISDLKADPSAGSAGTVYAITLKILDPQGPEDIVQILYQVREAIETIEVPIHDGGIHGDALKGDGIYTGWSEVPETAARQIHRFEVFVEDKAGHRSNVLTYEFSVLEKIQT
jgi:hypothetical protein